MWKPSAALKRKAAACGLQLITHQDESVHPEFTHYAVPPPSKRGANEEFKMSLHALLALADGRPIVSTEWVEESAKAGQPADARNFLLQEPATEKRYRFEMSTSHERARRARLLEGRVAMITPALLREEKDRGKGLKLILQSALGRTGRLVDDVPALKSAMSQAASSAVVVALEGGDDKDLEESLPLRCEVYSRAAFVSAIIQQGFDGVRSMFRT